MLIKISPSVSPFLPTPGRMYGADDFLPVLTYVIAQCDMLELDTEIEYMMELLDPSLLHGEGNSLLKKWEDLGAFLQFHFLFFF